MGTTNEGVYRYDTNVLVYNNIENSLLHTKASELIESSDDPIISSLSIIELGLSFTDTE